MVLWIVVRYGYVEMVLMLFREGVDREVLDVYNGLMVREVVEEFW